MFKISYIYDLVDNITPQLKNIQSSLEATKTKVHSIAGQMSTSFSNLTDTIKRTSQSFNNAGTTLAPLSVGLGLVATKAISSASNFETLGIQLEILTGSAEKGKKLFQELDKYSIESPFNLPEVVQATRTLLGSNIALKDVVATTKMLGDVSAGSGADIKSLAVVYGQVAGMTKLQGQDAMQFVSNGIPIWDLLQKATGKSIDQLRELATDGKISFDIVKKALTQATEINGMYFKATEKLSKSLGGLYSTLVDQVNKAFGQLGAEMVKAINLQKLITQISDFAGKLTDKFKALSPETQKFITYAILITAVLSPAMLILGSLAGVLGLATAGFVLFGKAIAMVFAMSPWILGLQLAIGVMYLFREELMIIYDFLQNKLVSAFDYVAEKLKMVMGLINEFRADTSIVLDFIGLDKLSKIVAPKIVAPKILAPQINPLEILAPQINEPAQINKPQQLTAGGQLDVNIKGLPQGSSAGFTPRPNNFLPVGVNSVFAGF